MKHLQLFESWVLNEWTLGGHWENERGGKNHELSRISPRSSKFPDGWECDTFLEVNSEGKLTGKKISFKEFREKSGLSREEFNERTTEALDMLVHSAKARSAKYPDDEFHRYVMLGKLAFKAGNQFFSPIFKTFKSTGYPYSPGEAVWGDVKDNIGYTFIYKPSKSDIKDFEEHIKNDKNKLSRYKSLQFEDYIKRVKITSLVSKDYTVFVPDTPDWKEIVKKQVDTGRSFYEEGKVKEITPEEQKWGALFKKDAQIVFDKGTQIFTNGKIRELDFKTDAQKVLNLFEANKEAVYYLLDKGNAVGKKTLRPGDIVAVVSPKDMGEKEIGQFEGEALKKDAKIVKVYSFQSLVRGMDEKKNLKINLKGAVRDIFVVLPDGTVVNSKLSKP